MQRYLIFNLNLCPHLLHLFFKLQITFTTPSQLLIFQHIELDFNSGISLSLKKKKKEFWHFTNFLRVYFASRDDDVLSYRHSEINLADVGASSSSAIWFALSCFCVLEVSSACVHYSFMFPYFICCELCQCLVYN